MDTTYIKSVKNLRDLGGMKTRDGHRIKNACFVRGGSLNRLTPEDAERLTKRYGVAVIFDLRIEDEVTKEPDIVPDGVKYYNLRLREDVRDMVKQQEGEKKKDILKRIPSMPQIYRMMVTNEASVAALKQIFQTICSEVKPGHSVYVHCSEGKDRTEIVMGLIEYLLGVDEKTIEADYLVSNKAFTLRNNFLDFWLRIRYLNSDFFKEFRKMYHADSSMLIGAKEEIESTYGSMENFFRDTLGVTAEQEAALKARVLQD